MGGAGAEARGSATPSLAGRCYQGSLLPRELLAGAGGSFAAPSATSNHGPRLRASSSCPSSSSSGSGAESTSHFSSPDPARFGAVSYPLTGEPSKDVHQPCQGVSPAGSCSGHTG